MSSHLNTPSTNENLNALSFEDALKELETIVRGLEGGNLSLEDALTAYERGAALRQHCEKRLAEAEMRVQNIVQNGHNLNSTEEATSPPVNTPRKRRTSKTTSSQTAPHDDETRSFPGEAHPAFSEIPY